jgi:transcriptional regulator with XRE-family HTH domain
MADADQGRSGLGQALRELRKAAGLSEAAAAEQLGTSARRISNLETGRFVPREDEIAALVGIYHTDAATQRRLARTARNLRAEPARARVVLSRGAWRMQRQIARIEEGAGRIRAFHCALVLGLAQTPAYVRTVFADGGEITGADLDRAVVERIARQAILDSGRDITLMMTEGALRWQAASPAVMIEQLAHLAEIGYRPGVRVGVIPWTTSVGVFPATGFTIYDSQSVHIGTRVATALLTDPQDVAEHEKLWGELEALASWDAEAREHLERIAADYRGLRK